MNPDATIRRDVVEELDFEPSIDAAQIVVTVRNGIVTLAGRVAEYRQKLVAEMAVFRVTGVAGIVQELEIAAGNGESVDDELLLTRVLDQFQWSALIPADRIRVHVRDGWVMLCGTVEWQFQREAAASMVSYLRGLRGVLNQICLAPCDAADSLKQDIEQALARNHVARDMALKIRVQRHSVILDGGPVQSRLIRCAIRQVAWSADGVGDVIDLMPSA